MRKNAFTLAELLMSLTVIGVIAALTLPVVFNTSNKNSYVAGCKKAYVFLQDAMELARINKPYNQWVFNDENSDETWSYVSKYISMQKECINSTGCWASSTVSLNNGAAANFTAKGYGSPAISFRTKDGMNVAYDIHGESFNVNRKNTSTIMFAADVNGDKKPNKLGEDIFIFVLGDNGLEPAGKDASGNGDCYRGGTGRDCAARVLKEGAINY